MTGGNREPYRVDGDSKCVADTTQLDPGLPHRQPLAPRCG
jgi:hypothetical protein